MTPTPDQCAAFATWADWALDPIPGHTTTLSKARRSYNCWAADNYGPHIPTSGLDRLLGAVGVRIGYSPYGPALMNINLSSDAYRAHFGAANRTG